VEGVGASVAQAFVGDGDMTTVFFEDVQEEEEQTKLRRMLHAQIVESINRHVAEDSTRHHTTAAQKKEWFNRRLEVVIRDLTLLAHGPAQGVVTGLRMTPKALRALEEQERRMEMQQERGHNWRPRLFEEDPHGSFNSHLHSEVCGGLDSFSDPPERVPEGGRGPEGERGGVHQVPGHASEGGPGPSALVASRPDVHGGLLGAEG